MRWAENITHMVEIKNTYEILIWNFKGNSLYKPNREDISESIFKKWCARVWTGSIRLRTGTCNGLL